MKNKDTSALVTQTWYLTWVFLPIGAYYLGIATGTLVFLLFPVLLVAAQYGAIRQNPVSQYPAYWWWFLLVGLLFFVLTDRALTLIFHRYGFLESSPFLQSVTLNIFSFYLSQMGAEFLLPTVFERWESGWWATGNALAAIVWIGVFLLIYHFTVDPHSAGDRFWYTYGYVLPSLFANATTGYFLHLGTKAE